MRKIIATVPRHDGTLAALCSDGRLVEQVRNPSANRVAYRWAPVSVDGLGATRIVHLAAHSSGLLIAVAADGSIWGQEATGYVGRPPFWRSVSVDGLDAASSRAGGST